MTDLDHEIKTATSELRAARAELAALEAKGGLVAEVALPVARARVESLEGYLADLHSLKEDQS